MSDKAIADILKRITALEKVIGGTPERPDRRLTKAEVAEREGVSTRTIDRRAANGFPPPDIIDGRCYWWLSALERYDAERIRMANQIIPKLKTEQRKRAVVAREFRYKQVEAA